MSVSQLWTTWFTIDFTFFRLNLGWIALLYSALLVYLNLRLRQEMQLTQRELHDWGEVLSSVTPQILELAEQGMRTKEIARRLEKEHSLPQLVSLKYMVALSRARKKDLS